jgi:hypothetical protein
MTTATATFSRQIRRQKAVKRTFTRPGCLNRFRCFIETSGWDELILAYECRIDRLCQGILIASILCLTPILVKIFLR